MDSKLVVEQMSGRWKIKHPDMRPLATEANRLAPFGTTYTWVPREQNKHADRLANEALDGKRSGVTAVGAALVDEPETEAAAGARRRRPAAAGGRPGRATTLVLVRHGVTPHTAAKRFSGGLAQQQPRAQRRGTRAGPHHRRLAGPDRRGRRRRGVVAGPPDPGVGRDPRRAARSRPSTSSRGSPRWSSARWDGLTFAEVAERDRSGLDAWLGSLDMAPPGGESFREVQARVLAGLDRVLEAHAGRTVVVVSHVTPIKTLVAHAVDAPLELGAPDGAEPRVGDRAVVLPRGRQARMRLYNARPPGHDAFSPAASAW